jgi:DNA-binding GntR family transcriptional regulator
MGLTHKSIVERVVEELEGQILNGELEPGQRITEEGLSSKWKVSRSSLREAFRILESQGFVIHEPRRGVRVSVITPRTVREVYQVRAALEGLTLQLAVQENPPKIVDKLKSLHERMKSNVCKGDLAAYHKLNQQFHETFICASKNEYLIQTLTPINKLAKRFRAEVFISSRGVKKSLVNHAKIVEAFENGNPEAAGEMRKQTVLEFGKMLETLLEEKTKRRKLAS